VTDLTALLQQFTDRYRAALLAKAALLATLGLGLAGVLAWRLQVLDVPAWVRVGVPGALAGLTAGGLGWWLRHRWISRRAAAQELDQMLGLKLRLVTAEEFADAAQRSSLYPLLVEDAARHCTSASPLSDKPLCLALIE